MRLFLCPSPVIEKNSQAVWIHEETFRGASSYKVLLTFREDGQARLKYITKFDSRMKALKMRRI